jgi:nucleotide-binding universal stress UspA family protein
MIRSVAVALDGSDHSFAALAAALAVAKPGRAEVRPVFVDDRESQRRMLVEAIPSATLDPGFRPDLSASLIQMEKTIRETAASVRDRVREQTRGRCKLRVVEGNPVEILVAESMSADLIAMGRSGFSPATGPVKLGRVTRAVVRGSPCPVLAVQDGNAVRPPFLVPYSGSSQSNRALRLSANLAAAFRARVELLVVRDKPEEAKQLVEEAKRLLAPHKVKAGFAARAGSPADAIAEAARTKKAGLIVMGAYGQGALAELLLGSTTEKVVEKTPCAAILCT